MSLTPIFDFVEEFAKQPVIRCFMPGHKGRPPGTGDGVSRTGAGQPLAWYAADITEIPGADDLYESVRTGAPSTGIIAQSEEICARLFGATATCYSTQGSTLGIQAMVYLAKQRGNTILAGRGAHLSFVRACMLVGLDVVWLVPEQMDASGLLGRVTPALLAQALATHPEVGAVYLTSPDYLGTTLDLAGMATLCERVGVPLLVDNAHGAYLAWGRGGSRHPLSQGVSLCCDSAHKTLPVLTGGGYLHLGRRCPWSKEQVKEAMAMFASTSPSYLLLTSLDCCNRYLAEQAEEAFARLFVRVAEMKLRLRRAGLDVLENSDDFAKLTLDTASLGRSGVQVGNFLHERGGVAEYTSERYVVLLLSPAHTEKELACLTEALLTLAIAGEWGRSHVGLSEGGFSQDKYVLPEQALPLSAVRERRWERIPIDQAVGRIAAELVFHYPPGVAVIVPGERVNQFVREICEKTGKKTLLVVH